MTVETVRHEKVGELAQEKLAELRKADDAFLAREDKDLNEGEKIRKQEILKEREAEKAESKGAAEGEKTEGEKGKSGEVKSSEPKSEDKTTVNVEKRKEEIQSEIDKLVREKKTLEEEVGNVKETKILVDRIAVLEAKLAKQEETEQAKVLPVTLKQKEEERIAKYLEEDKDKSREERREMSKEEIDNWYLEDPTEATAWINERTNRRREERKADESEIKKPKDNEFAKQQAESLKKLYERFPKLKVQERGQVLKTEGKSDKEIFEILSKEVPEYKIMLEIVNADPKRYEDAANGPELVMAEMEKRLNTIQKGGRFMTDAEIAKEREEAVKAEQERLKAIDEGVTSTRGSAGSSGTNGEFDKSKFPNYDRGLKEFLKASRKHNMGWTEKDYQESLLYRKSIDGADEPDRDEKGNIIK